MATSRSSGPSPSLTGPVCLSRALFLRRLGVTEKQQGAPQPPPPPPPLGPAAPSPPARPSKETRSISGKSQRLSVISCFFIATTGTAQGGTRRGEVSCCRRACVCPGERRRSGGVVRGGRARQSQVAEGERARSLQPRMVVGHPRSSPDQGQGRGGSHGVVVEGLHEGKKNVAFVAFFGLSFSLAFITLSFFSLHFFES